MGRGLSAQQWGILEYIARMGGCASHRSVSGKAVTPSAPSRKKKAREPKFVMSDSQRVSQHRSLARLLERGLIAHGDVYLRGYRRFIDPGYVLTDAGHEALRLRGINVESVKEFLSVNVSVQSHETLTDRNSGGDVLR